MSIDGALLPKGAKGIEVDDFVIEMGRDKIVLLSKFAGDHYTLHAGNKSGILDLHRTWRDTNGVEQHQTLFAIRRDDLFSLLATWTSWPIELLRLLRPLRIGWLYRHGIGIVHGLDPTSDDEVAAITRKRRKRLVVDEDQWHATLTIPEYLDEVRDFPDGAFSLFSGDRKIGIGFKKTDSQGEIQLFWLKLRDLTRLAANWQQQFIGALQRYAIPPERYGEYPALQR